jgi:hypothetical protein
VGQAIWKASQKPVNREAMAVIGVADETVQARFTELLGEPKAIVPASKAVAAAGYRLMVPLLI